MYAFRRRVLCSITAVVIAASCPSQPQAQSVQRFETYGQAVTNLLGMGVHSIPNQYCRISALPISNEPGLSGRLNQICHDPINGRTNGSSGGASLGGGLLSVQSIRTVSQFLTRREVTQNQSAGASEVTQIQNSSPYFLLGTNELYSRAEAPTYLQNGSALELTSGSFRLESGQSHIFGSVASRSETVASTDYQAGYAATLRSATLGVATRFAPGLSVGIQMSYGTLSGASVSSGVLGLGNITPVSDLALTKFDCKLPDTLSFNKSEYGGSVFSTVDLFGGILAAEFGVSRSRATTGRSLCLLDGTSFASNPEIVWKGIINTQQIELRSDARLRYIYNLTSGTIIIGPRLGLDGFLTRILPYEETETPVGSDCISTNFAPCSGARAIFNTTGAGLAVNAQTITSIQSRSGMFFAVPMTFSDARFTPFFEATRVHEFANGQREIVARFAGDNRANPTWFSFKTNAPDRNFYELAGGFSFGLPGTSVGLITARRTIGNDLYDSRTVEGSVRIPF